MKTMLAAYLPGNSTVDLREVAVPTPGINQVLIKMKSLMRRAINKGEKRDKCLCCCVTNREKELQKQSEVTRRDEPNYRISFVLAQI